MSAFPAGLPTEPQHLPQGAMGEPDGSVVWRVWAPQSEDVALVTWFEGQATETAMTPTGYGYFEHRRALVQEGLRYAFKLHEGRQYPDPASRWQPDGVHQPSAVFLPGAYRWSDSPWCGIASEDLVLYELHVGAFTPEGTFDAIIPRLPQLASLGVTALELMPVAQFPGQRNWGYDGVYLYAAQNSYGGPRALQRLVDAAHQAGLAVVLDVVYNHLGPEGNYLGLFGPYFTDRYHTPWGHAINFDGPDCDPVRQFVIDNACAWVRDFHLDGLRLDAVQTIYDLSARHILADIQAAVQAEAARQNRIVHVMAETNQNDVRLVSPPQQGGHGLDGVWADDFHHSVHALLTGERDGYYEDFGRPEHLAKAFTNVFVYDGCYSPYRRRRHGSRVADLDRCRFVVCIQNHDQVGNRARGDRLAALAPPEALRLACGLLLLSPCVPLLFMGEEYGEDRPFPFFCSFGDAALIEAVRRGRRAEFAFLRFAWRAEIPDPQAQETFDSAKLCWQWPAGSGRDLLRRLYQDLLGARRRWPALRDRQHTAVRLINGSAGPTQDDRPTLLVLERGIVQGTIACANLTSASQTFPALDLADRKLILSTEEARYGGSRTAGDPLDVVRPYEMLIFGPEEWRP